MTSSMSAPNLSQTLLNIKNIRMLFQLVILATLVSSNFVIAQDEEDYIKIQSELELIQWDLQDECSDMSRNVKDFLRQEVTGLRDKIRGEVDHANFLRLHSERLKVYEDVPYELQRNWTYFTKCGDVLLSADEFKAFTVFANKNLELKLTDTIEIVDSNGTKTTLNEADVLNVLATNRNATVLQDVWMKWESGTKPFKEWYYDALKMVNKATLANDFTEVETFWEMLSEMQNGYDLSKTLFENIQPLYNKLHNFVRIRINKHYNTSYEDYFPTYLTGSFLGDDWSNIAEILLPNPQLYYDMKIELEARDIEDLFRYAGNATKNLGFGDIINPSFFQRSEFNENSCETHVFDYCAEKYSSIVTCNKTNLANYFNAYETVMQLGLTKVNFASKVTQSLRYSPVNEGMQSMASLLSINGMLQNKIIGKHSFIDHVTREENRMTVLILLALRILPKIAYYHAIDTFRMDLLANHGDVVEVYKKHVKEIQGLLIPDNFTTEFLRDEGVMFNKPYLSKMLGLFLQFQLLDYYQIDIFEETDTSTLFNKDTTFRDFVLNIPFRDAQDLLSYYYNIEEIADFPLASFFSTLDEYLDIAPLEQAAFKIKAPKFVRTTTTTTTPAPKTKNVKTKPKLMRKQDGGSDGKGNSTLKDIKNADNEKPKIVSVVNANTDVTNDNVDDKLTPVENSVHAGIYIGAGIVVITLAIIAAGFISQRRRTQYNNRRYNA